MIAEPCSGCRRCGHTGWLKVEDRPCPNDPNEPQPVPEPQGLSWAQQDELEAKLGSLFTRNLSGASVYGAARLASIVARGMNPPTEYIERLARCTPEVAHEALALVAQARGEADGDICEECHAAPASDTVHGRRLCDGCGHIEARVSPFAMECPW